MLPEPVVHKHLMLLMLVTESQAPRIPDNPFFVAVVVVTVLVKALSMLYITK